MSIENRGSQGIAPFHNTPSGAPKQKTIQVVAPWQIINCSYLLTPSQTRGGRADAKRVDSPLRATRGGVITRLFVGRKHQESTLPPRLPSLYVSPIPLKRQSFPAHREANGAKISCRKAAYHGAEVGTGGEPEPGAAEGGAPEGLPESRHEMKAFSRRHGDGDRGGRTMSRMSRSERPTSEGLNRREAARKKG